jgi:hypothetical protein
MDFSLAFKATFYLDFHISALEWYRKQYAVLLSLRLEAKLKRRCIFNDMKFERNMISG